MRLILLLLLCTSLFAQDIIHDGFISKSSSGVGTSMSSVDASAIFQLDSTSLGMLIPRMTEAQRDAISSPATGLIIYNTDDDKLNVYDGASWKDVGIDTLTAERALESDASGNIVASDVTNVELNYLDGVTSAIQTQLDAKQSDVITTQGDVIIGGAGGSAERLALGTNGQVLSSNGTTVTWDDATAGANSETVIGVNYLTNNSGFELGDDTGWTATTLVDSYISTGTVIEGTYSVELTPSGADETFISDALTLPPILKGESGENLVACLAWSGTDADNWYFKVKDNSSNVLVNQQLENTSSGKSKSECYNFPSNENITSVNVGLYSIASGTATRFDSFMIGLAKHVNIGEVQQAEFYGGVDIAGDGNHVHNLATGTTWTDLTDVDIIAGDRTNYGNAENPSTVGDWAIKFSNLPPGRYEVKYSGILHAIDSTNNSSQTTCLFRFYDGTTESAISGVTSPDSDGTNSYSSIGTVIGEFEYTNTQSSITFNLQGYLDTGDLCQASLSTAGTKGRITVHRYPLTSETAYKANTTPLLAQAYHDSSCLWSRANAAYGAPTGDSTCTFDQTVNNNLTVTSLEDGTGEQPAIKFTPPKLGVFEVCVSTLIKNTNSGSTCFARLQNIDDDTDILGEQGAKQGTADSENSMSLCGLINVTTIAEVTVGLKVKASANTARVGGSVRTTWTIKDVSQNFPMPQILNNVESSASGGVNLASADLNCDAGSAITGQDGSWVSSIGNISSGVCAVTLNSGSFGSTPNCSCSLQGSTLDEIARVDATSATNVNLYGIKPSDGTALASFDCELICVGDK